MQITRKLLAETGMFVYSSVAFFLYFFFLTFLFLEGEKKPTAEENESMKILPGEPSQSAKEEKSGAVVENQQRLKTSSTDSGEQQQPQRRTRSNDNNTASSINNVTTSLKGLQPFYGNENEGNKEVVRTFLPFSCFF
jgi:hypothetical protein